ncbi:hypothetical protein GC169_04050 [bacterium]|nr:hypothetical protein [bacterium]
MESMSQIFLALAALLCGGAAASGWTSSVIVANDAFDGMDHGRADRHLRKVISSSAGFQAALLGVAAGFAIVGGATGAFITALLAALGFLSNVWTLSPRRGAKKPPGVRERKSTKRVVAVSLTLLVTIVAFTAGCLAAFGV